MFRWKKPFRKAYGVTPDQFDQAVKAYYHSLTPLFVALDASKQPNASPNPPQVYHFPVPVGPNDSAKSSWKPMRETDARAFVAGIKTRIPDRREAGFARIARRWQRLPSPALPSKPKKKRKRKLTRKSSSPSTVAAR